jgi:hypothetical protein
MKKHLFAILFCVVPSTLLAVPTNSSSMLIRAIAARDTGVQVLSFYGTVPDQGCTNNDRAVIVETSLGGASMYLLALSAAANGKSVGIRVDGCVAFNPEEPMLTAPRIIRISLNS